MRISISLAATLMFSCAAFSHEPPAPPAVLAAHPAVPASPATDWRTAEKGILENCVQLTFSDRFVKAGESYFSPDDSKIIFQAVEKSTNGQAAEEFYAMFVADVVRDAKSNITRLANYKRISPPGSANTCGWFHPTQPNIVTFGSTITKPTESTPPGFQRASNSYRWMFPKEMRIVRCDLTKADGSAASLETIVGDGNAYRAEDSFSPDGRHLLYCSLEGDKENGDLYVYDTVTKNIHCIVKAKGYDGGPFFSPDGKRICYRSDRRGDNNLQLFVADLAFNEKGEIVGIEREYQLTDDLNVNWCPFWTHDGRHLVYSTSALGHENYEIFVCDADPGNLPGSTGTIKYGTAQRRVTFSDRADVLPAFSRDGKWMIWTSRRTEDGEVQLVTARFVMDLDANWKLAAAANEAPHKQTEPPKMEKPRGDSRMENRLSATDPETGRIFIYDLTTHTLSEYDMSSHQLIELTNPVDIQRATELFRQQEEPQ